MKKLILMLLSVFLLSCSIDRVDTSPINTFSTQYVNANAQYPSGGYWIFFYTDGVLSNSIFLSNGKDGKDGLNGLNGKDGTSVTIRTETAVGGTTLIILNGTEEIRVFIKDGQDGSNGKDGTNGLNGKDGKDGINGVNGLPGADGKDGVSSTIRTEQTTGGYNLYITVGGVTEVVFIANGTNGTNGLNGQTGLTGANGTNGVSSTIRTVAFEGGYTLIITVGTEETRINIYNGNTGSQGIQGIPGVQGLSGTNATVTTVLVPKSGVVGSIYEYGGYNLIITVNGITTTVFVSNGKDGTNGTNGTNGDGTVTICHKVTHGVKDKPEWDAHEKVTLTLTLSEYIQHIYEYHNGNSTQNDSFGSCN